MAKKDEFDKIDSDKDGVISEDEFANASKSAGVEKEKLNWFLKLITLGDRFSMGDFFDRAKKGFVEFLIVFFGVLVSFGVEQKGDDFEDREWNIENLHNLKAEMDSIKVYTLEKQEVLGMVMEAYKELYETWDSGDKYQFIWIYGKDDYDFPLEMYTNRDPFNPPRVVYDAIKLDGTFRFLGSEIGQSVYNTYEGQDLKYLKLNTDKEEEVFTRKFNDRVDSKWVFDLEEIDFDSPQFWIKNREYVENDQYVKYNLFKRMELWEQTAEQIERYLKVVESSIELVSKEIKIKDAEITIVYWVF
ncbi:MAG: hypothetical protein ACI914_001014 [Candidatus Marivariicella framensis]|jgi:hypothetical protein|tara:strand:- start:9109 stop:10014 length:906 start_codon:yes stop_codon:yes gene_type:complete